MKINKTGEKGITMVSLVVTIILLIILAGVSIHATLGEDGIITIARKAKENMEYAQTEEQTKLNELYEQLQTGIGDFNYDNIEKINDFKKAIAEYIEQAGGVKPEPPETAPTETFGESILGLSSQDATATPDKILKDYTAYVKGEKIVGTLEIPSLASQTLATAVAGDIISGKTAWVNGSKVTGTMVNQGAKTATINAGQSYTIPAGYHNGSGKITAATLASQTGGTATADKILKDYTAYVNGQYIVGTMSNNGAVNVALNAGQSYTILPGYHNGQGKVTAASLASQTSATATTADIVTGKTAWVNGNKITGTYESLKNTPITAKYSISTNNFLKEYSYTGSLSLTGINKINITFTAQFMDVPPLGTGAFKANIKYKYMLCKNDGTVTTSSEIATLANNINPSVSEINVSEYDSIYFYWCAEGGGRNGGSAYLEVTVLN